MLNTKSYALVDARFHPVLIFIGLLLILNGCSQISNQNEGSISNDALSVHLPSALKALTLDASNLVVDVVIDELIEPCTNLTVDQENATFSCDIAATLSVGPHMLALVYSIIDAASNKVVVTTTSEINVDIIAGQTTRVDFSSARLIYDDNDEDGITNLREFENGTDPTDPNDPPKTISVPGLVGLTDTEAETQINAVGLTTGLETLAFSDIVEVNRVISQDPASGATVAIGSSVALVISKGAPPPATVPVPDCSGSLEAACISLIKLAGLTVGSISLEFSDTVAAEMVISQQPANGEIVVVGSSVALVISKGAPPPVAVLVPDCRKLVQAECETLLKAAGLVLGLTTRENSATVVGTIIRTSPLQNTKVAKGAIVDIVISNGRIIFPIPEPDPIPITPSDPILTSARESAKAI